MQQVGKNSSDIELDLKRKRQQVRVLDSLIIERTMYQREQEQLITNMIESGNVQLMGLNHDILLAKQELKDLKVEIRTTKQDKAMIEEDLQGLQVQIVQVQGVAFGLGIASAS